MPKNFSMRVRTALRPVRSSFDPRVVMMGDDPVILVTYPNIADRDAEEMIVDIDATGFDPRELAGMFTSLAAALTRGARTDLNGPDAAPEKVSAEDRAWAGNLGVPEDDGK